MRILLAGMPLLLREIIESVVRSQADLELVGATDGAPSAVRAAVAASDAEVAIVGLVSDAGLTMYDDVLFAHPTLRLLAVTGDGRDTLLYELRPHRASLGDASAAVLLGAIRGARSERDERRDERTESRSA